MDFFVEKGAFGLPNGVFVGSPLLKLAYCIIVS